MTFTICRCGADIAFTINPPDKMRQTENFHSIKKKCSSHCVRSEIVHQNSTQYILQLNVWHSNRKSNIHRNVMLFSWKNNGFFIDCKNHTHTRHLEFEATNVWCKYTLLGKYTSEVSKASFIFDERSRYECHSISCQDG